jgi:hypothetical protein
LDGVGRALAWPRLPQALSSLRSYIDNPGRRAAVIAITDDPCECKSALVPFQEEV